MVKMTCDCWLYNSTEVVRLVNNSRINRLWQRHVLQSIDFACPFAIGQMELFSLFIHSIVIMWACSQHYLSQSIFPPPVLVLETSWLPFTEGEGKIGSLSLCHSLSFSKPADEHTCRMSPETSRLCIPPSNSLTPTSLSGRRTEGISHRRSTRMRSAMGPVQEGTASMH